MGAKMRYTQTYESVSMIRVFDSRVSYTTLVFSIIVIQINGF